jgi:hypothetical protein
MVLLGRARVATPSSSPTRARDLFRRNERQAVKTAADLGDGGRVAGLEADPLGALLRFVSRTRAPTCPPGRAWSTKQDGAPTASMLISPSAQAAAGQQARAAASAATSGARTVTGRSPASR